MCENRSENRRSEASQLELKLPGIINIPEISIIMKCRDAFLVGVTGSDIMEITLKDVLTFHGYCAGGVTFAFRAAQEAFKELYGQELPVRQAIKVQTSYHCCQAGALAYITGARSDFGAERVIGDLELIPKEEKKIVFSEKNTGKQATLKPLFDPHDIFKPLFQRLKDEPEIIPEVREALQRAVLEYANAPAAGLFEII